MNPVEELIFICNEYREEAYSLPEFQRKLEMVLLPDTYKNTLEIDQRNVCNVLEEIRFCYREEEQKKYARQVASELILCAKSGKRFDWKTCLHG